MAEKPASPDAWAADVDAATRADEAGGKAANLGRLMALGAPVPTAFVLGTPAFKAFLDAADLDRHIDELTGSLDLSRPDQIRDAAGVIRDLVLSASIPGSIALALERRAAPLLASGPVVVRSSAVGEDGVTASFAGQLDSVLQVRTTDDLLDAVRTCWASYWSERALFYRLARRAPLAGMGVVIQRQVNAVASGVLFTRHPAPASAASEDTMLVEYCAGFGEGLVSGRVDPGRVEISRSDLSVREVQALPDADSRARVAMAVEPRWGELAALAGRLEREFGGAQDIEWVVDAAGALWIVQTRPVTAAASTPPRDTGTTPGRTVLWSNVNVSENFPAPISPLLYSIASAGYANYFRNLGLAFGVSRRRIGLMEGPLAGIIGVHGARMYYNLTNIHAVLRMAPYGAALARAFNRFVGADRLADSPADASSWHSRRSRLVQAAELVRIAASVVWQYAWLGRRVRAFERQADAYAGATLPADLSARPMPALGRDLSAFMEIRCRRWKNASLADAAAMVAYAMLERQLARAEAPAGSVNRLLRALPGVPSSQPPVALWRLSRLIQDDPALTRLFAEESAEHVLAALRHDARWRPFATAFDDYLDRWGFRSSAELMLTEPTLAERPAPVIDMLREYARPGGESPEAVMARQARDRKAETRRLLRGLVWRSPVRALLVWRWVTWAQRAVAYRERVRLKQALLYTRCRHVTRALGLRLVEAGLLRDQDDAFWLTWRELEETSAGLAMLPHDLDALVRLRRTAHARVAAVAPPDTFELPESTYARDWADPGAAAGHRAADAATADWAPGAWLTGTGASGGTVTARAAVLDDLSQASLVTRGHVLVTRQTDPGWGPLFCLVSGLVVERGGMLSHGAIIAREFGLPCVVGIANATTRIPQGSVVTVDGDRGRCEVSDAEAAR